MLGGDGCEGLKAGTSRVVDKKEMIAFAK